MAEIKLFVSSHKVTAMPDHPLLVPIQVGTSLSQDRFSEFLHDDTGENISDKNRFYCELTAQYWAWKNVQADFYGFFHYRRYLYPDTHARYPYRIESVPTVELLDRLGYGRFAGLISQYDLILPIGEDMHIPVREHYAKAPHHHGRDLELAEQIIQELHPEYVLAMEEYLSGTVCYFGSIFIARREVFQNYSGWLFPILAEFDRRADLTGYGPQEQRVDGYLAERLLGVYVTWLRENVSVRTAELPRVHFEPDGMRLWKKRTINCVFPPGSRRRAAAKKVLKKRICAL